MDEILTDPLEDQRTQAKVVLETLSPKQRAVMEIASRWGKLTLKEIARELPGKDISDTMVSRHIAKAKDKLGVASREAAAAKFLMLDALANPEKYEESNLFSDPRIVEKLLSDLSSEQAPAVLMKPIFQEWLEDARSKGPKGKTALYGPWWKIGEASKGVAITMVTILAGLYIADWLNGYFAS